jgi:hypothetical protein
MIFLFLPFALQGLAMVFDELYFHRKRGLGLWERVGHPVDSLSVAVTYGFLVFNDPNPFTLKIYIGLAAFSCLLVTKDEFVHSELCEARENWLHALLFVLHPVTFLSAGWMWYERTQQAFLQTQTIVVVSFMFYQILYWSPLWNKKSPS